MRLGAKSRKIMGFFDLFKKKKDNTSPAEQAVEAQQAEREEQVQKEELAEGLQKTKAGFFSKLARAVAGRSTVDATVLDDLEEVLITSDVAWRPPSRSSSASRSASPATSI